MQVLTITSFLSLVAILTHSIDWIRDKETSKFAFAALCQEKSFIPLAVWKAGEAHSNLIETVHRDVNREGVHCTIVGGLLRGQAFDVLKAQTLMVSHLTTCCVSGFLTAFSTGKLTEYAPPMRL